MTHEKLQELRSGLETAYIDGTVSSNLAYKPQFISKAHRQRCADYVYEGLESISIRFRYEH